MTQRQQRALARIRVLHREFAENASLWTWPKMAEIAEECEQLIRAHWPHDAQRLRLTAAPLAFEAAQSVQTEERALAS